MKLGCGNCKHEFSLPEGDLPGGPSLPCPRCGAPVRIQGPGALPVSGTHCFRCGRAMESSGTDDVPICPVCVGEEAGALSFASLAAEEACWLLRKQNGEEYGPFDASTVEGWIRQGRLVAEERIALIGEPWQEVGRHPEFRSLFRRRRPPPPPQADVRFRKRRPVRRAVGRAAGLVVSLLSLAAVVGASFLALERGWFLVPEDWIEQGRDIVELPAEAAPEALPADRVALFAALSERWPESRDGAMALAMEGRRLGLDGGEQALLAAQAPLEQAVAADPTHPFALASLAECYIRLAEGEPSLISLHQDALVLLRAAEEHGSWGLAVQRARARLYLMTRDLPAARAALQEAMVASPDDPELITLLGRVEAERAAGLSERAEELFRQALALSPDYAEALLAIGDAAEQSGRYAEALEHLGRHAELLPDSAYGHFLIGRAHFERGALSASLQPLGRALELQPALHQAALMRAQVQYQVAGDPTAAIQTVESVLEAGGEALPAADRKSLLVHLSGARREAGQLDGAVQAAHAALEVDEAFGAARFHLGLAEWKRGNLEVAAEMLARASEDSNVPEQHQAVVAFYRGLVSDAVDRPADAIRHYDVALALWPDLLPANLWLLKARLGGSQGPMRSRVRHPLEMDPLSYRRPRMPTLYFHEWPSLAPLMRTLEQQDVEWSRAPLLTSAGVVAFHGGQQAVARRFVSAALREDEREPVALLYAALLSQQQGQRGRSIRQFREALEKAETSSIHYLYLAELLREEGDAEEAQRALDRALALDLESGWAYLLQAELAREGGDAEEAAEAFERARALDPELVALRQAEHPYPAP